MSREGRVNKWGPWRRIHTLGVAYAFMLVALVPAFFALQWLSRVTGVWWLPRLFLLYLAATLATAIGLTLSRCPRCAGRYFWPSWNTIRSQHCAHCGLPKYLQRRYWP